MSCYCCLIDHHCKNRPLGAFVHGKMVRVYLDQRIKFWLALMGLLTLAVVYWKGGNLSGKPRIDRNTASTIIQERSKSIVILHRSNGLPMVGSASVGNAYTYAKQNNLDFKVVTTDWMEGLREAMTQYEGGVILLDGSSRSSPEEVVELSSSHELTEVIHDSSGDKTVGIYLTRDKFKQLDPKLNENLRQKSAVGNLIELLQDPDK